MASDTASFIYTVGNTVAADKGATHGAYSALGDDDFMKGIVLDQKTDDVQGVRQKITAFGVRVLEVPDPHL